MFFWPGVFLFVYNYVKQNTNHFINFDLSCCLISEPANSYSCESQSLTVVHKPTNHE